MTADRLKRSRNRARLTQQQAAELIGVHVVTWRRWESTKANKRRMSPQMWELWQLKTERMR